MLRRRGRDKKEDEEASGSETVGGWTVVSPGSQQAAAHQRTGTVRTRPCVGLLRCFLRRPRRAGIFRPYKKGNSSDNGISSPAPREKCAKAILVRVVCGASSSRVIYVRKEK